jgi:hypothetical protein
MITLRQLTINDLGAVQEIVNDRPEVFNGYSDEEHKKLLSEHLDESILANPLFFNLGLYRDGQLLSAWFAKEMTTQPAWVWGYWITRKGSLGNIVKNQQDIHDFKNIIQELDAITFEEMEDRRKLNRFYLAYPFESKDANGLRTAGFGDRLVGFLSRNSHANRRINRYKFFTDCVIEPNTMPRYPYQQQLIGDRTYPIKLGIRMACLEETQSGIANGS